VLASFSIILARVLIRNLFFVSRQKINFVLYLWVKHLNWKLGSMAEYQMDEPHFPSPLQEAKSCSKVVWGIPDSGKLLISLRFFSGILNNGLWWETPLKVKSFRSINFFQALILVGSIYHHWWRNIRNRWVETAISFWKWWLIGLLPYTK